MNAVVKRMLFAGTVLAAMLCAARPAIAQVTTGNISGTVTDQQGGVLPGAVVVATHVPTGTTYEGVTGKEGRFQILEVRVGGPYTVAVTMSGFKPVDRRDVTVKLGEDSPVNFKLELAGVTAQTEVTAAAPLIDFTQPGSTGRVSAAQVANTPSISRSIFDSIQTNPNFLGYISSNTSTTISVAGRNNRYNNILIDGSVDNDIFGLSPSGTPEGQTGSQPISLDAVQEIQLLVSPYDVRQGQFTGGGVNAITKSGTNEFHGGGLFVGRNQSMFGKYMNPESGLYSSSPTPGAMSAPEATFSDRQMDGTLGGPIAKDKVFFFGAVDSERQATPSGIQASGSGSNVFLGGQAVVDQVVNILKTEYNYNPCGPLDCDAQFIKHTTSDKYFGRVDFNLGQGKQLTVRHNFVNSSADIGTPSTTNYLLPDGYYKIFIKTNNTVGQYNWAFGHAVNELRVATTFIRNYRSGQDFESSTPFPYTTINVGSGLNIRAGRENSSQANRLNQDDVELNDDLTFVRGTHTFTIGTHDEFFKFYNLFTQNLFGNYTFTDSTANNFNGIPHLIAGQAQAYSYFYSNTADPLQGANFSVRQWGGYAGDTWRVASNFTVTYGLRVDAPRFIGTPNANPVTVADFNMQTNIVPSPIQYSPRMGFNWDIDGKGRSQIRGGVGMFGGRTPYVWLSNQYSNDGIDFTKLSVTQSATNCIPFIVNTTGQSKTPTVTNCTTGLGAGAGAVGTNDINLVDPNYKFPSLLRGNAAYDSKLPWGMAGTLELLWSKTLDDVQYENLNYAQTGTSTLDGRPIYSKVVPTLGNVVLLTNTHAGHNWSIGYSVRRPFSNHWYFDAGYLYGQARTPEESQSSVALTSWQDVYATNQYHPAMSVSDFDPGHRVTADMSYTHNLFKDTTGTFSLFYAGQSGHPYSVLYSSDANGDSVSFNDLFTGLSATSPVAYTGGTYTNLQQFLQSQPCLMSQVGSIIARNSCRAPWLNTLNGRFAFGLPFKKVKAEITLDVINLLNLLDSSWGLYKYYNFNELDIFGATVTQGTVTSTSLSTLTKNTFLPYSIDDTRSRWQMQLGGRISF